jgi:hypothetical protein
MTDTHKLYSLILLVLCFMVPLEAVILGQLIRKEKLKPLFWVSVVGVQLIVVVLAYITRSNGYEIMSVNGIDKIHVEAHIAIAEMFIAVAIASSAVSIIVLFLNAKLRYPITLVATFLMLIQSTMSFKLKNSGFEVFSNYQQPSSIPEASILGAKEIYDDNDYGDKEPEELEESQEPED